MIKPPPPQAVGCFWSTSSNTPSDWQFKLLRSWNFIPNGHISKYVSHRISSNKHQASNKHRPLISATPLGIHIEISTAPLNTAFIRRATTFY